MCVYCVVPTTYKRTNLSGLKYFWRTVSLLFVTFFFLFINPSKMFFFFSYLELHIIYRAFSFRIERYMRISSKSRVRDHGASLFIYLFFFLNFLSFLLLFFSINLFCEETVRKRKLYINMHMYNVCNTTDFLLFLIFNVLLFIGTWLGVRGELLFYFCYDKMSFSRH